MLSIFITLIVVLIVVGLVLWILGFLPLDPTIQQIIRGLVIILAVLYVLFTLLPLARGHLPH